MIKQFCWDQEQFWLAHISVTSGSGALFTCPSNYLEDSRRRSTTLKYLHMRGKIANHRRGIRVEEIHPPKRSGPPARPFP